MAGRVNTARDTFILWCDQALTPAVHCLKQMAKTIRKRLVGLLVFWNSPTSDNHEALNSKIGWLTRQAYGYRV